MEVDRAALRQVIDQVFDILEEKFSGKVWLHIATSAAHALAIALVDDIAASLEAKGPATTALLQNMVKQR